MQVVHSRQLGAAFTQKQQAVEAYETALKTARGLDAFILANKAFVKKAWPNLPSELSKTTNYLEDKSDEIAKYSDTFNLWGKYVDDANAQNKTIVRWQQSLVRMIDEAGVQPGGGAGDVKLPDIDINTNPPPDPDAIPWIPIAIGGTLVLGTLIYLAVRKR